MLTYLVQAVQELYATAIFLGLAFAFAWIKWQRSGRRVIVIGLLVGFAVAIVMAWLKNTTSMVDTGLWNMRIFVTFLITAVIFGISFIKPLHKKLGHAADIIQQTTLAAMIFLRITYAFPDEIAAPFNFDLGDAGLWSTDFFFRLIGWILGLAIILMLIMTVFKAIKTMEKRTAGLPLGITIAVLGAVQTMNAVQTMLARRILAPNHTLFSAAAWMANNALVFDLIILIITGISIIILIYRSLHFNEPYKNPAEHRKIKAKWRNRRRWSCAFLAFAVASVLIVTVVDDINNTEVELSPAEECEMRDDGMYVSLEQVSDGHLHRFKYTTDDGIGIRFIVIKKPNSSAYGIGLDACDICGETGYYERDGEVVCKKCDVVMNINTIGYPGGCNPIVIDYEIANGYIHVPYDTLLEHKDTFKTNTYDQ